MTESTESTENTSRLARTIVMGVVVLGIIAMFGSSMIYRFANPELQKQMRPLTPQGMGQGSAEGGAMDEGMPQGMMDMDGVREMMAGLEKRVEDNPKDIEALMQLANIQIMRQDKETAMVYLEKARVAGADDPQALMQLSRLFFDLGEFDLARQTLESILAANPDDMFAHYNLGVILKYRLNDKVGADEHFRIVSEGDHNFDELRTQAKKELE